MVKECEEIVCYIESSLNQGFIKQREFIKELLVRIQGTRHEVCHTGKFIILEVRQTGV